MAKSKTIKTILEKKPHAVHKEPHLLFGKTNYILIGVGMLCIAIGFILMSGGGSDDPNVFDAEAIYSARRITYAPIMVILGFVVTIVAILKKPN